MTCSSTTSQTRTTCSSSMTARSPRTWHGCKNGPPISRMRAAETNPLEARLGWTVKLAKGTFIGSEALQQVKEHGPKRLLVGVELLERGIPRGGYALYENDQQIGVLTSGAPGLTVHKNIGMGYVEAAHATVGRAIQVDIRGKRIAAQIVALPFYKRIK